MMMSVEIEEKLLVSEGILNVCCNGDGSNAILLPEKKKSKTKGAGKISKKGKSKGVLPSMSKSKQRKLKQLQEEKERKILQSKSIKLLERFKIRDDAYSLLHSSGTIGQTESMREKRIRAVQFSKAGLEVPEDVLPYRKKIRGVAGHESEVTVKCNSVERHLENSGFDDSFQPNKTEAENPSCVRSPGSYPKSICEGPRDMDIGSYPVLPTAVFTNEETGVCISEEKKIPAFLPSSYKKKVAASQNHEGDGPVADSQITIIPPDFTFNKPVDGPTIVHVTRPSEVESKRRDLPIFMMEQEIMEAINENSILIICGETGCGKTTQVPQFLYEAGFGSRSCRTRKGIIGVTQPRRVAVLATAKRVSFELGVHLGKVVGFQVRHDKRVGENCSIKFMTDGILLREVQSDFLLKQYSIIILDEAHERSLNTDILIGMLSRVIRLRQKLYMEQQEKILSGVKISHGNMITQLKLVLMSATLRVEDFISDGRLFHEPPPIIEIPTRQFPVSIHFSKRTDTVDYVGQAYKKVMLIHKRLPPGGILVFVTGQREVEYLCKKLRKASEKLAGSSHTEKTNDDTAAASEVDMKEISEAFETGAHSPYLEHDMFSSYKEDYDDSCSSDSETESETIVDSDDENFQSSERTDLVLDFLREPMSLASLKASFEALVGDVPEQNCEEQASLHVSPTIEGCLEGSPVSAGALKVLPLYAMLPASKQLHVFEDVCEGERLVVVATNVAETSLTIPGIKYIVDTGREKVKNYSYTNGMATYEVQWISKASAAQRAGRAGRTGPGHCYRLYSSAVFCNILSEFSNPEITKTPVDGIVLLMKSMGIDKVENFPFPTAPESSALQEAESCLKALEALDGEGRLTYIGKAMARYPMSPHHSRMLLTVIQIMRNRQGYARANMVLGYAVASVAALSFSNPFIMHPEGNPENKDDSDQDNEGQTKKVPDQQEKHKLKKQKAMLKEARKRFNNPSSDALTISYALQSFELEEDRVEFCRKNVLHLKTMDEMSKLRKQLLQLVFHESKSDQEFSWNQGNFEDVERAWRTPSNKHSLLMNEEELLGQAICAGWADRVAKRIRTVSELSDKDRKIKAVKYQSSALNETVFLHHSSSTSQTPPDFLVYTELLSTKRAYMHGVTSVKPDWLVKYASSLCSFSVPLTDPKPYYEPLTDQLLCWVSPTFGPHLWQLPLHSLPIKNDVLRVSVFAYSLLGGNVIPCLRSVQKFLAAPPSSILRPEASGQRRVSDLLNKLKTRLRMIDSRAALRETWHENPQMLHSEIKCWFQEKFHSQFEELWLQMHHEVLLDVRDLFPKGSKKEGKKR